MCSRCNAYKPPRAHHCSQCDRCIMKMDHHCPWVNNCVGANNQKHFLLFCFYTALLSLYALVLLLWTLRVLEQRRIAPVSAAQEDQQAPEAGHPEQQAAGTDPDDGSDREAEGARCVETPGRRRGRWPERGRRQR